MKGNGLKALEWVLIVATYAMSVGYFVAHRRRLYSRTKSPIIRVFLAHALFRAIVGFVFASLAVIYVLSGVME